MKLPILIISIIIFTRISYSCKESSKELEGYEDYPLVQFMRENGWVGKGDSTTSYPQDSVLYNGLKIDGKSLQEVEQIYGDPRIYLPDTLRYGISQRYSWAQGGLFPLTYQRAEVPMIYAQWQITDKTHLFVFFENINNETKAIYGIQLGFY